MSQSIFSRKTDPVFMDKKGMKNLLTLLGQCSLSTPRSFLIFSEVLEKEYWFVVG